MTVATKKTEKVTSDFDASNQNLLKLKAGRDMGDIPLNDPYWEAVKEHDKKFGGKQ